MNETCKSEILEVTYSAIIIEQEDCYIKAQGNARTNASNPRLVPRPSIPEVVELDFEADPGPLQMITPVEAKYPLSGIRGIESVTVYSDTNKISIQIK